MLNRKYTGWFKVQFSKSHKKTTEPNVVKLGNSLKID